MIILVTLHLLGTGHKINAEEITCGGRDPCMKIVFFAILFKVTHPPLLSRNTHDPLLITGKV